jgi:hypothetical protein
LSPEELGGERARRVVQELVQKVYGEGFLGLQGVEGEGVMFDIKQLDTTTLKLYIGHGFDWQALLAEACAY